MLKIRWVSKDDGPLEATVFETDITDRSLARHSRIVHKGYNPVTNKIIVTLHHDYIGFGRPHHNVLKFIPMINSFCIDVEDPCVIEIARKLEVEPDEVIEAINRFYGYFPSEKKFAEAGRRAANKRNRKVLLLQQGKE